MDIMVVKEFQFDAAHFLPNHPGKCKGFHGHTYKLQIGVSGEVNSETGMVVDFADLKEMVDESIIEHLDHKLLNSVGSFIGDPEPLKSFPNRMPTAEMMVSWIATTLYNLFLQIWEGKIQLHLVRLYETPTSYAEWRATR